MSNFESALMRVLRYEGGYVNDPDDVGKETKYGITKLSYPSLDIKNLTLEQAAEIYRRDWWDKYKYYRITYQPLAEKMLIVSINIPAVRAHIFLQRSINILFREHLKCDGILGDITFSKLEKYSLAGKGGLIHNTFIWQVGNYYLSKVKEEPKKAKFLRGWLIRTFDP